MIKEIKSDEPISVDGILTSVEVEKDKGYNQALEDFETKMAYFCFGLKARQGYLCRVDVVEDELVRIKRQLKILSEREEEETDD